mgnify:CR=1 FL=1
MVERLFEAFVERVIDGDTIEALVQLGFGVVQRFRIRVAGIDTPETKGTSKRRGKRSAEFVRNLIEGKTVWLIESEQKDKYGRAMASVQLADGRDLATLLVEAGLAKKYSGGKKTLYSLQVITEAA